MHTVGDLLEQRAGQEVVWIEPLACVYDALKMMNERNVGALLVQIDDYLVGILSERDYVPHIHPDRPTEWTHARPHRSSHGPGHGTTQTAPTQRWLRLVAGCGRTRTV